MAGFVVVLVSCIPLFIHKFVVIYKKKKKGDSAPQGNLRSSSTS